MTVKGSRRAPEALCRHAPPLAEPADRGAAARVCVGAGAGEASSCVQASEDGAAAKLVV